MTNQNDTNRHGANLDHGWQGNFGDARLDAPTFHRNHAPIVEVMQRHLEAEARGSALEIGSGSGQHIIGFATRFANLHWIPSDPDARNRDSIEAWRAASPTANVACPLDLDASQNDWMPPETSQLQAMVCINVLHIAPWSVTMGLLTGAGRALANGSPLFIYGPFKRNGQHTAESNAAFDAALRARNPEWGVRDIDDIEILARAHSLNIIDIAQMPANNFTLVIARIP